MLNKRICFDSSASTLITSFAPKQREKSNDLKSGIFENHTSLRRAAVGSTSSFTKFFGPVVKFLQTFLAHAGPDIDQTSLEIFEPNRSNFIP